MNTLSFFSGIGGLDLGIHEYMRPLAHCDTEAFCQQNVRARCPSSYLHGDVRTFPRERFTDIGLIVGGFPCQDISNAGKGGGIRGKRSGLVWALLDLIDHYRPPLVFLENVSNLRNKGMEHLLVALDELDYDVRWCIITGFSVGALHRRGRTFILAKHRIKPLPEAHFDSSLSAPPVDWSREPDVPRVHSDDLCELAYNNTRLKALGNAVIPQQARRAFHLLLGHAGSGTLRCLETAWRKSVAEWSGVPTETISSFGSYREGQLYSVTQRVQAVIRFPATIQRFRPTHSLPTPTATEYVLRMPTNVLQNRAFRPGVNKSVSLNRWVGMFPTKETPIPAINDGGYLVEGDTRGRVPYYKWVEWLMGFPVGWVD